jgi:diguanylate cyclase (GGDEF)-like protein
VESDHDITRIRALDALQLRGEGDDCLVVIHTPVQFDLGKRYILHKDLTTIGRDRDNDIVLDSDNVSRRHAKLEHNDGCFHVVDLASTNGTFINDEPQPVTMCRLRCGDQLKIGDTIFKYLSGSDVEAQYHQAIFNMAVTDSLTDVSNKKQLDSVLTREVSRALRYRRQLSVVMIDIDHFKQINDTYGHLAGDTVLRDLAGVLRARLRPDDELGRCGGEEFCVILPETPLDGAVKTAEDLRRLIEGHTFAADGQSIKVTVSIGVAELKPGQDVRALYKAADDRLYDAKRRGRNQVCR